MGATSIHSNGARRRPADGSYVQVYGRHAFAPQQLIQGALVACTFVLWAWLKAGGAAWLGAITLVALLAGQVAAGVSILRSVARHGVWIALDGTEQAPVVIVLQRGPVGQLRVRSSDGRIRRVPGSLHRSAPVIKIRGRLVAQGVPKWQRLSWNPATESVTELARRIEAGHPPPRESARGRGDAG